MSRLIGGLLALDLLTLGSQRVENQEDVMRGQTERPHRRLMEAMRPTVATYKVAIEGKDALGYKQRWSVRLRAANAHEAIAQATKLATEMAVSKSQARRLP